jgi:mannose-6-phosphate isomerase-like protein (cupin superfamily)
MERAAVDGVDAFDLGAYSTTCQLTAALDTEHVALNHYRLAPGDGFPNGLHAHADQEEVFVVLDGEATFETCASPVGDKSPDHGKFTVGSGEAVRFAPGEFQSGRNAGDAELVALALGAPRESENVRIPFACPACGDSTLALDFVAEFSFVCPDCGVERVPADCPNCGHDDLRATLNDKRDVVAACEKCSAAYEHPPVRGEW